MYSHVYSSIWSRWLEPCALDRLGSEADSINKHGSSISIPWNFQDVACSVAGIKRDPFF